MNAATIARALGGRKAGGGWTARCPVHDDRTPSLSIRDGDDGKLLVRCHAGCDQKRVIAELLARGLWNGKRRWERRSSRAEVEYQREKDQDQTDVTRRAWALAIWNLSHPAKGTLVETYFRARGILIPPPNSVRFNPHLKHPSGGVFAGMVALVTRGPDDMPIGIHRTFIARSGAGKAPVAPAKMMLGPCRGGAVRLGGVDDMIMVAEGIETALAAMQATGYPAWAALSTSGLRNLELAERVREVIVLADGDDAGEAAALNAAHRWKRQGRRVRIARPPTGLDFNDLLMRHPHAEGRKE